MGIRQAINERPAISFAVIGAVILAAIVIIFVELRGSHPKGHQGKSFYSDDNGASYFVDEANKITPFVDAHGKQAVQAAVFRCGDGPPFVAYLTRYSDEAKAAVENQLANPNSTSSGIPPFAQLEVKRPKDARWTKYDSKNPQAFKDVTSPVCPDGGVKALKIVLAQ